MKNMLKTTLFAGVAAMLAPFTFAADAAQPAAQQPQQAEKSFLSADKFSASVSFAYESNYVFRGIREAQDSLQPEVEVAYAISDALGAYVGVFNNSPLDDNYTETDINVGMTYQVAAFTFDLGYTLYWNTSLGNKKDFKFDTTNEIKVGVSYDTSELLGDFAVTPSLYYYYDFDMECNTVEVSLDYSAPISKWILGEGKDFLSLDTSIYYGYRNGSRFKAYGDVYHDSNGYSYVGINADLVLRVNEICALSFGVRWANVNAHSTVDSVMGETRPFGKYADTVWFGTSMTMGF